MHHAYGQHCFSDKILPHPFHLTLGKLELGEACSSILGGGLTPARHALACNAEGICEVGNDMRFKEPADGACFFWWFGSFKALI